MWTVCYPWLPVSARSRGRSTLRRGSNRSPRDATRSLPSAAVKVNSFGSLQLATSFHARGMDTVGRGRARSEYGATVVF
ncbi:hypothetical protein [Prauserella isguenensis]|uniref:hypothetical protein n=1 Tax=Prauserella isguenensis TaxID=1470180 RepID=UPI003CCDA3B9